MICCDSYYDLGCVGACGVAQLPLIATQTGTHILEIAFNNVEYNVEFEATIGQSFNIDLSKLNENYSLKFKILQPNNIYYAKTDVSLNEYVCFILKTKNIFKNE